MIKILLCWLLFCTYYLVGSCLVTHFNLPLSGAVCGLLLLFASLLLSRRLVSFVTKPTQPILANMTLFFIPAVLGVLAFSTLLFEHWIALFSAIFITTVLSLIMCGWVTQALINLHTSSKRK